jgi:Glycosyl transferase family 2
MSALPPVALFVYRRPDHARRTVTALAACPEARNVDLVVFSDGARDAQSLAAVEETRELIRSVKSFRSVRLVERPRNFGLFQNVVTGLTEMFQTHERVVVLEDDIEVRPDFLSFMHAALKHYESSRSVYSVTGYMYPAKFRFPAGVDSFLFPRFCCWGWATWKDRWETVDWSAPSRASFMKSRDAFRRFWSASNDLPEIMLDLIEGKNSSWSILFNYEQIRNGGYCVYPTRSFARNIGFDGTGTHEGRKDKRRTLEMEPGKRLAASAGYHFADTYDEIVSKPLAAYFRNSPRRQVKNLLRYGRLF